MQSNGGNSSADRTTSSGNVSRRKLLAALGASGTLLAGCSGDGGDDGGDSGDGQTDGDDGTPTPTPTETPAPEVTRSRDIGEAVDPTIEIKPYEKPPQDWDHSPYQATMHPGGMPVKLTLAPPSENAGSPSAEFEPHLMSVNELRDGNEVWHVELAEGFTWHDGEAVTMEDRFNRVKYNELRKEKFGNTRRFESVELIDDSTMEHTLKSPTHPSVFLPSNSPGILYKASYYEPYLESMTDATSPREAYMVHNNEFAKDTIPPEEWVGNGIWAFGDIGENRVILEKYEDYPQPYNDYQNIQKLKIPIRASDSAETLLMKNDKTDWYNAGLPDGISENNLPGEIRTTKKKTTKQYKFRFNHNNKHLNRRGVRRAIAHIKRFGPVVEEGPNGYVDEIQDGTTPYLGNNWVSNYEERAENFIYYGDGYEPQTDRATGEMQSEDYERNSDGQWVGPEGDAVTLTIKTPWWFQEPSQTLAGWMTQFGIETTVEKPGLFWKLHDNPDGDWQILISFHSRGPNHPSSSYKNDSHWAIPMYAIEDGERVPVGNRDFEYELPTELGATDLTGETETIHVPNLQDQLTDPTSSAEDWEDPFKTLNWWWNFYVPDMVAHGAMFMFAGDYGDFRWLDWNGDGKGDAVNGHELRYSLAAGYTHGRTA